MGEQIITDDKEILKRYGRNSKPIIPEPENPTPIKCNICQEMEYPRLIHRKIVYIGCKCATARPYHFSPPK